jgi:hypothetical protein
MLRQTVDNRAPPCSLHLFSPLTVTFSKLSVILGPLYVRLVATALTDRRREWLTLLLRIREVPGRKLNPGYQ